MRFLYLGNSKSSKSWVPNVMFLYLESSNNWADLKAVKQIIRISVFFPCVVQQVSCVGNVCCCLRAPTPYYFIFVVAGGGVATATATRGGSSAATPCCPRRCCRLAAGLGEGGLARTLSAVPAMLVQTVPLKSSLSCFFGITLLM